MYWDRRAAAWLEAQLRTDGPVHDFTRRIDPYWAKFTVRVVTGLGAYVLGENVETIHTTLELILHQSEAPELGHRQAEDTRSEQARVDQEARAEQARVDQEARAEQARVDQEARAEQARIDQEAKTEQARIDEQAKAEQARIDERAKAEHLRADGERAAAVIEEQTVTVEEKIAEEPGKSKAEIDALEKDFKREQQDLEGKLDGLAKNYFDKYPDLSKDQRDEAEKTFQGIKDEAMGNLRGQQESRREEVTRAQQQQREELEERRKGLEGTRAR